MIKTMVTQFGEIYAKVIVERIRFSSLESDTTEIRTHW